MKTRLLNVLLITLCSYFPAESFSQNYQSIFGQNSTMWSGILFGACDAICSGSTYVSGDTAINSTIYKKLPGIPGFIREDANAGKVMFYDTYTNSEFVVMDLGLSVGDTFPIYNWSGTASYALVDSVYLQGGLKRVRINYFINICMPFEKIIFIEGSGPTSWFNYQASCCGVASYMLCHYKDGVKITGNTMFQDSCQFCEVGISENEATTFFKIFPNPAGNELSLNLEKPFHHSVFVIKDVLGKQLLTFIFDEDNEVLNIESLENGLYFISGMSGGFQETIRFVKANY